MLNISQSTALLIMDAIAFAFLVIAATTDIKNNTISIGLFPTLIAFALMLQVGCFGPQWGVCVVTGIALGIGFLAPALLGRGGGGDAIMFCCLGLCIGPQAIFIILLGMFAGMVLVGAYKFVREGISVHGAVSAITDSLPLAPYALFGFIVYLVVGQIL